MFPCKLLLTGHFHFIGEVSRSVSDRPTCDLRVDLFVAPQIKVLDATFGTVMNKGSQVMVFIIIISQS